MSIGQSLRMFLSGRDCSLSPQDPSVARSWSSMVAPREVPRIHIDISTEEVLFIQPCCWEFMWASSMSYTKKCITSDALVLWLLQSSHPLFCDAPWALGVRIVLQMVLLGVELTMVSCSLKFDQLCLSGMISFYNKKKLLWCVAKTSVICGYEHMYSACNFEL